VPEYLRLARHLRRPGSLRSTVYSGSACRNRAAGSRALRRSA